MADASGWLPFVTLALGYGAKTVEDWIQNKRTMAREREARDEARRDQRFIRRITFQRETLLELQEASLQLARATGKAHYLDEMAFRESRAWRKSLLPDDLDEGYRVAQARNSMLSERVQDKTVRDLVGQMKTASTAAVFAADRDTASRSVQYMSDYFDALHKRIGELLREIDSSDQLEIGQ
ncbi:hypothetical protein V1290_003802 [Bradyrhizobium sp. AZCC 1578]|uniref:hypothetical protein n=1 Tax=Bradyrhizobium sp. AZCC 1578 TaxID=3117027 RepID=UPI002FEEF5C5